MLTEVLDAPEIEHRNFNICPHCIWFGKDGLLSRLSEGPPMISRSDGKTYHLLMADKPLPYPAERFPGPTQRFSVCFWYSCGPGSGAAQTTVVLLPGSTRKNNNLFRRIEWIADILALMLQSRKPLGGFYDLRGQVLQELQY